MEILLKWSRTEKTKRRATTCLIVFLQLRGMLTYVCLLTSRKLSISLLSNLVQLILFFVQNKTAASF